MKKLFKAHFILNSDGKILMKAQEAQVGEIRTHKNGKKYKKVGPDQWVPVTDNNQKQSVNTPDDKKPKEAEGKDGKRELLKNAIKNIVRTFSDVFAGQSASQQATDTVAQGGEDTQKLGQDMKRKTALKQAAKKKLAEQKAAEQQKPENNHQRELF